MAIVLTLQPTNNGYYTAYLPVEFTATETANNPKYLVFRVRNANGTNIAGVPDYNAPLINGSYKFNASQILKSLFDVRTEQGLSVTAIEELTDLYKKVEVLVSDPTGAVSSLVSNEIFAFAFLDTLRFTNDQTANNGISNKKFLLADFETKVLARYSRVNFYAANATNILILNTFLNNTAVQTFYIDLIAGLISVPLSRIISLPKDPLFFNPAFVLKHDTVVCEFGGATATFKRSIKCNTKEFVFVNKYGVKETLQIESKYFEKVATKSTEFERFTSGLVGANFNTGTTGNKVNQAHSREFAVQGQRFTSKYKETVSDFVKSPKHWLNINSNLYPVLVFDQSFTLVDKGKGVDLDFRYKLAQKELAFV